jgi:transposase
MARRRQFTREFKLQILEQLKSKSVGEVAKENDIHPMILYRWKNEFEANPAKAFAGHGKLCKLEAEVADYQRLTGKLYAQVEFLKKASETLKAKLAEERIKRS